MRHALPCRCSRPLILSDDPQHCVRCGHGPCVIAWPRRASQSRRLPRDLGALQREGRRPDPNLENVVRLDRLRERPVVVPVRLRLVDALVSEWPEMGWAA